MAKVSCIVSSPCLAMQIRGHAENECITRFTILQNVDINIAHDRFFLEDTLTLREMILSIPLHIQNIHVFPDNINYKVPVQIVKDPDIGFPKSQHCGSA